MGPEPGRLFRATRWLLPSWWLYTWTTWHFVHHDCDGKLHDRFVCRYGEGIMWALGWLDR